MGDAMIREMEDMEQEPIALEFPLGIPEDVFLRGLEEYVDMVNDHCLSVISERLGISREQAEELANKMQDEAMDDYVNEQVGKLRFLCTK